jgi:hypothetical protein
VFLLAFPVTALYQMLFATGVEAVIHGALALGSALMSFAVFDFKTPRWATWMGSAATGVLAAGFFVQGLGEMTHDEALAHVAYPTPGGGGWSTSSWLGVWSSWATRKSAGIVAMATVA